MVKGGPGDDILCGGRGTDKLLGGDGNDTIFGEEENDTIVPGPGDDRVLGSAGDDRIYGWGRQGGEIVDDGIDILDGGFNDDILEAGGADTLLRVHPRRHAAHQDSADRAARSWTAAATTTRSSAPRQTT